MKIIITLIFSLTIASTVTAQDKTVYFDNEWKKCEKKDAKFYRIIKDFKKNRDSYLISDYFISGEIQMQGTFSDKKGKIKNGTFIWYFKNGNKKKEASFVKNICIGTYRTWYLDGSQKVDGEFLKNKENPKSNGLLKVVNFIDSLGNLLVTKGYGEYYYCSSNNKLCSRGKIEKGLKHGTWSGYDESMRLEFQEEYKKGKLLEGISTDNAGKKYEYTEIEERPNPGYDMQFFLVYLKSNIIYPIEARKNNVQGKVYIRFWVTESGFLEDFEILKKLGLGCDEEAVRVLKDSPNWTPGRIRGKVKKMEVIAPITFKLS